MPQTPPPDRLPELWSALELTLNQSLSQNDLPGSFNVLDARIAVLTQLAAAEQEFDQFGLELNMLLSMRGSCSAYFGYENRHLLCSNWRNAWQRVALSGREGPSPIIVPGISPRAN